MKILNIAFKDITQSFRSFLAIAMMFVVPILITGMFALLFGGGSDDEAGFEIPVTSVVVANLDQGDFGEIIVDVLDSEDLTDFLLVNVVDTAEEARSTVDDRQADAAVIIPPGLSASVYGSGGQAEVEIYQDPTLTLGPGIVTTIVEQLTDGFSGSTIAWEAVDEQLAESGVQLSTAQILEYVTAYQEEYIAYAASEDPIRVESPSGEAQTNHGIASMLAMIMGGMMIFYTFFTGTNTANSLLTEEDNQTLARMLSTATSPVEIIAGKLVAGALMVIVQVAVLLSFGRFAFDIRWGELWLLVLFTLALTLGSVTFGLFAISLAKDRKQSSLIVGGGVTITGMLGMSSIFMVNSPNPSQTIDTLTLLVPQGWANRALLLIMDGFSTTEVLVTLLGLLVYSAVLFFIGTRRFLKRFA